MNNILNGTGWGELPKDDGIEIPEFMRNYQYNGRTHVPVSAYCGQAMGRERRRQHQKEKNRRDMINGVFWCLVGFGILVAVVNLGELICG